MFATLQVSPLHLRIPHCLKYLLQFARCLLCLYLGVGVRENNLWRFPHQTGRTFLGFQNISPSWMSLVIPETLPACRTSVVCVPYWPSVISFPWPFPYGSDPNSARRGFKSTRRQSTDGWRYRLLVAESLPNMLITVILPYSYRSRRN